MYMHVTPRCSFLVRGLTFTQIASHVHGSLKHYIIYRLWFHVVNWRYNITQPVAAHKICLQYLPYVIMKVKL